MGCVSSPLDNPFVALEEDLGETPPWVWKGAGTLAGVLGAMAVRELIDRGRTRVTGRGPNRARATGRGSNRAAGAKKSESWPSALFWAAVVGMMGAVGRLLAQHAVARAWRGRATFRRA